MLYPRPRARLCPRFSLFAVCLLIGALSLERSFGQTGNAQDVNRAQTLRSQTDLRNDPYSSSNGVDGGYAVASPNDPDLGEQQILKRQERYQAFSVSASAPFYYTSNVALSRRDEHGDFLIAPQLAVSWNPRITSTLFGDVSVSQQLFYYDRFSELNFGSFTARAGLIYYLPRLHDLTLRANYEYNRLTFADSFDEFFANHSLNFGAEMPFHLSRATQIVIGADASVSVYADPERPRRNDFDVFVAYDVNITRALSLDAAARLAVRQYYDGGRADVSEIFSLSANYRVAKWFTVSAIANYAANQSNQSVFDYQVGNIGGAVGFTWRF